MTYSEGDPQDWKNKHYDEGVNRRRLRYLRKLKKDNEEDWGTIMRGIEVDADKRVWRSQNFWPTDEEIDPPTQGYAGRVDDEYTPNQGKLAKVYNTLCTWPE